jgi:hypothetical protein
MTEQKYIGQTDNSVRWHSDPDCAGLGSTEPCEIDDVDDYQPCCYCTDRKDAIGILKEIHGEKAILPEFGGNDA